MVWVLRILLGVLVLSYGAWLGLPLVQALAAGQDVAQIWSALAPTGSPQAVAMAAGLLATIGLYAAGGLATAGGLTAAPGIFYLGFIGELTLRLAVAGGLAHPVPMALDLAARTASGLRPLGLMVETTPLALAALLAVGLCILATGVWRGQKGVALTRVWSQPPAWA